MELQEKNVKIRKLTADENKIIVSKETQKDENGNDVPLVRAKEIYLRKRRWRRKLCRNRRKRGIKWKRQN